VTHIAPPRALDREHERGGIGPDQRRPGFLREHPFDLGNVRQRRQERLCEAETDPAGLVDQFKRRHPNLIDSDLRIADGPIALELKSRDAIVRQPAARAHPIASIVKYQLGDMYESEASIHRIIALASAFRTQ